jgi:hypothetical protein
MLLDRKRESVSESCLRHPLNSNGQTSAWDESGRPDSVVMRQMRACDLTKLRVRDIYSGQRVASRATVMQQKTQRPVQFEITKQTRDSVEAWIRQRGCRRPTFCSRAEFTGRRTSRPAGTHVLCIAGLRQSGLMTRRTERTSCVEPKRH